ncbi:MAG TPA: SIMPL domain-containing protein [Candidatus Sulfotelmatobacter sp.]|jgi:predicted secreted protein|nr:SIMPL domain-containing protein [Candidatus Sulfotelmatobacter sp.]
MFAKRLPLLVAAFLFLPASGPAWALDGNISVNSTKTEIQLVQSAERLVPRDRLMTYLRVELKGSNPKLVQSEVNHRMMDSLTKAQGVPSVVAETGSYSVHRPYNEKEIDKWEANQDLALSSDSFDDVLSLAGTLQGDGLVMSSMRFFVAPDPLKATQDELTTAALKALKDRAERVAADLWMKIERYKTIGVGNASEQSGDGPARSKSSASNNNRKALPPTAVAGESLVSLTVRAVVVMTPQQ